MAYKALYRKYRPDSFKSVVGQLAIIRTLQNIIKEDKINHAFLFSGPRGIGKTSVAKIFAKAINCLNPKDGMPCGECSVCLQIKDDQTNDIIEIDAASNNGVDEIRDLKSKINLVPTVCKYKVYIIDEVHMLSMGAFNALLKTLEEPPRHVVFILATTEIQKIPLTIISRCQNFNFKKITEEQMKIRLDYITSQEQINIDDEALYEIAKVSDGGLRDAIGLLEQLVSLTNNNINIKDVELLSSSVSRDNIAGILENIVDFNIEEIFKNVDIFYQDGKDFVKIAEDIVIFLKDILLYKKAEGYFRTKCAYNIESYKSLINKLNDNSIYKFISEVNKMIVDLKVSSHPKTIFEITLLKLIDEKTTVTTTQPVLNFIGDQPKNEEINEKKSEPIINKINKVDSNISDVTDVSSKEYFATWKEPIINGVNNLSTGAEEKVNVRETEKTIALKETVDEETVDDVLPLIKIQLYKKILINNTLALAEKELLTEFNNKCGQLQTFLINKDFKQAATVLLDGKIVGASNQNIIYVYPYDTLVEKADEMLEEVELLLENIFGSKYKIVNITDQTWSEVRPYYVKLKRDKKTIDILPEIDMSTSKKKAKTKMKSKEILDAINMFGEDMIEIK